MKQLTKESHTHTRLTTLVWRIHSSGFILDYFPSQNKLCVHEVTKREIVK